MRRFFATFLVAMLATAGLAACGGDDDNDDVAATEAGDDSGGDDSGGDSGDDITDEMDDELADLVERQSSARIRITYEMSGDEETTTYSQDGEGRTAIFTGTSSVFVSSPDGAFSCDGLDTDAPTCQAIPEGMEELATIGLTFFAAIGEGIAQQSEDLAGVDTSEEEIAGRNATCYDWDASALLGGFGDIAEEMGGELEEEDLEGVDSARVCIDDETGWLLELSSEGDDAETFLAIEVGEPLDSDFEAPAPIEENS